MNIIMCIPTYNTILFNINLALCSDSRTILVSSKVQRLGNNCFQWCVVLNISLKLMHNEKYSPGIRCIIIYLFPIILV